MIRKVVWCLFILIIISENHCSPTELDLYAFSTLVQRDTPQSTTDVNLIDDKVEDAETAETNTRPNPRGGGTRFNSEDASLEDSQEDPPGPEDHVIPYSEHENPDEVSTRPKYVAPGAWAKPDPKKNIPLDFVPTKSLAQVRGTHTVRVLPQSEAIASATSDEERQNAPRLREVVSKKKTNTIYTEEGYEDSAYDHAGHIRDADFHEGYARKLHDQQNSEASSGNGRRKKSKKKKRSKKKNSRIRPEEFEEFTDDYSDEYRAAESSKKKEKQDYVNKIYKDMWKKPDINPKFVTENEIEKLENDLKREAEEAEKGSENYGSGTERDIPRDYSDEDANSENAQYTGGDVEEITGSPGFESQENLYTENYDATTVQFETPRPDESERYGASTSRFENPKTNNYQPSDGSALQENYEATTYNYNYPNPAESVFANTPHAVNYGEIFWKYFQTKPNDATSPSSHLQEQTTIQQPLTGQETTTLGPHDGHGTPLALATINGHGPYLLVSDSAQVTQKPNQFELGGSSYHPNTIYNQEYGVKNSQGINSRSGETFSGFPDPGGPSTSGYGTWGLNNAHGIPIISAETSTTSFYDSIAFSSTPTYSFISLPPNNFDQSEPASEKDSSHHPFMKNPFLNSAEDTVGSQDSFNHGSIESSYENWLTQKREPDSAPFKEQSGSGNSLKNGPKRPSAKSQGNKGTSFFSYEPNLDFSKTVDFNKADKNGRNSGQKSESADSKDFTIMKPPALRESVFSDFTLNSYPNVAAYSTATQESEAAHEANKKKVDAKKNGTKHNGLSHKDIHFKTSSIGNSSPAVFNRKRLFPASKLLPPAPYSKDDYAVQNSANRNDKYHESFEYPNPRYSPNYGTGVPNYSPDPKQLEQYFNSRKTASRYARSLDEAVVVGGEVANSSIAQKIDTRLNFTSEDQGSMKYRDIGIPEKPNSRAKRNLIPDDSPTMTKDLTALAKEDLSNKMYSTTDTKRSWRRKRSHQDLLDASHKIAGDVVDKEIDSRFKSKDYDAVVDGDDEEEDEEEDEEKEKGERQVEIEAPDWDYLDEIQDVNEIEIPTTTVASIDFKKYPFYKSSRVPNSSPLKYIINPKEVPKKTFGGMEFYDSRDKYVQCDEVDPNLEEVLPDEEEPVPNRGPKENLPRLRGLGDKLDCYKAKYFGENPFDNPLFFERKINQPTPPTELNPMKLVSRILEMPQENRNYFVPAQSRKPENRPIKRMDNTRRRKTSRNLAESSNVAVTVESKDSGRNKAQRGKVRESSTVKPQTESRGSRKRRPTERQQITATESPETDSVTPYQKEVYDDVMGTIKNLASLYEMFGAQNARPAATVSQNRGHILGAPSIKNVKTVNRVPTLNGKRENAYHPQSATEIPFPEEIEGLLPPPEVNRKPKILPYRTNKVSYNTRARTESPPRNGEKKIIGYFRTVMVHKRSLDDQVGAPSDPEIEHTVKKRYVVDSEFGETRSNPRSVNPDASSSTTERPKRGRRRKTSLTTTTTMDPVTSGASTEAKVEAPRPLYTVRSRSRHSNDEKSTRGFGLFTTTERPSAAIDSRRNEPRYAEILRRRGQTATTTQRPQELSESTTTTTTASPEKSESLFEPITGSKEIYESEDTVLRRRKVIIDDIEPHGEIYKAVPSEFEPERVQEEEDEDDDESENYEEEHRESKDKSGKKVTNYDVHEDVQEDTTPSVVGFPEPTKVSEYVDLETFLSTDPPGYSKAFSEEAEPTAPYSKIKELQDDKENYREEESKEEEVEEENAEYREAPHNASYQEEESSEEDHTESPKNSESYTDLSRETGDDKKNLEREDGTEKPFFRYDFRPDSPFESFEDDKYSELGPRINKPAFYHPPFKAPEYEGQYFKDSEEKEKDKSDESSETAFHDSPFKAPEYGGRYSTDSEEQEKDKTDESSESAKYAFPWSRDEEDEKAETAEGFVDVNAREYEYPWEKRERLAEERAKRRKDREKLRKLRDFSFLHDDDEFDHDEDEKKGSSSKISGKRVYPWDVYDVPSESYKKNFWKSGDVDSIVTSSEHRPVAKFSSKYNSNKFKIPFVDGEPITTADPKKIRKSVLKLFKEVDEEPVEPTVSYETEFSTTIKPSHLSSEEEVKPTVESISSGSKVNKKISNWRIVPENITAAPRNKSRSRVKSVRDRTTLRPIIRSTTQATTTVVPKSQTTPAPIVTSRRPARVRGRPNLTRQPPSYKAQEYQVATETVESKPNWTTTSTTEKPTTRPIAKSRRRGRPKTVKTDGETSLQGREEVTEGSTQPTTTIHRRIRPTITTRGATTKAVKKNSAKPKGPGRVDTKNFLKESAYDEYRIPEVSSVQSGDHDIEDFTPPSRTVEHRSRVSKEQIITKTSFPELDTMYKAYADKGMTKQILPSKGISEENRKSKKPYSKSPERGGNSVGQSEEGSENPVKNETVEELSITTNETPEHVYQKKEILDKDGHRGMFISITPKNRTTGPSAAEDELALRKAKMNEEFEKQTDRGHDSSEETERQNSESEEDFGSVLSKDKSVEDHALQKTPSQESEEANDSHSEENSSSEEDSSPERENRYNEYEESNESEEVDESEEESSVVNFEKDPSRRLYYYLDPKK